MNLEDTLTNKIREMQKEDFTDAEIALMIMKVTAKALGGK